MISSPGDVIASTACMNAMLAPAVTMIRLPRPTSMLVLGGELLCESPSTSGGMPAPSLYSWVAGCGQRVANGVERLGRRSVVHDALSERNRARASRESSRR